MYGAFNEGIGWKEYLYGLIDGCTNVLEGDEECFGRKGGNNYKISRAYGGRLPLI